MTSRTRLGILPALAAIAAVTLSAAAAGQQQNVETRLFAPYPGISDYRPFFAGLDALLEIPVQYEGRVMPLSVFAARSSLRGVSGARHAWGAAELWDDLAPEKSRRGGDRTSPAVLDGAPMYPAGAKWFSGDEVRASNSPDLDEKQFLSLVDAVSDAAAGGRAADFGVRAAALRAFVEARARALGVAVGRVRAEAALERTHPFAISALLYVAAGAIVWIMIARKASRRLRAIPIAAAFAINVASVAFYGYAAGRIPVNNSYEGMLIFSVALGALAIAALASARSEAAAVMGAFLAAAALLVAQLSPLERGITPPAPVLQSLWLQVHVLTCFVAYAAFAMSFASSWVVLASRGESRRARFDAISYGSVLLGLVFLTAGILTGAAWAKQAWGRYWGFDPKETWALVTWLVYAAYLHLGRLRPARRTFRAAAAIIGFAAVMFTFFGVNYVLKGLHSYN